MNLFLFQSKNPARRWAALLVIWAMQCFVPMLLAAGTADFPELQPSTPQNSQQRQAVEALRKKMAELDAVKNEPVLPPSYVVTAMTNASVAQIAERRSHLLPLGDTNFITSTNAPLEVKGYEIIGNSLLPNPVLDLIFQPYLGTNMNFDLLRRGLKDLQTVYRDRGYVTVSVRLPQQKLTNGFVKIRVFEGHLVNVLVTGNHYFDSNNVIRSLPGLRTNMVLLGPVFQAELDRANANQDRQISPQIEPGPDEGETVLRLKVKDRLPLHGKVEFNNESSPGTPDLRASASAVYNNLWQEEHSLGLQYSASPEKFKTDDKWAFFDKPLVANYSAYYRMPLTEYEPIQTIVDAAPGSFGFSEADRKFRLPPPSGRPELNVYASRATIDTSLLTVFSGNIFNTNGNSLDRQDLQQDYTVNQDIGFRFSVPIATSWDFLLSTVSTGLDFKTYDLLSNKTNSFTLDSVVIDDTGGGIPVTNINHSQVTSPVPTTDRSMQYLPLSLRYDGVLRDALGVTYFGIGMTVNLWHSGSSGTLQSLTSSTKSSGNWVVFTPNFSRDFAIRTNWILSFRADGQWSSEPLISNEQYGVGGVNSVRGYHEGELFGDTGWHISLEQKTPPHVVGIIGGGTPLTIRGSAFADYGEAYLLDAQGRQERISLCGVGLGVVAAAGSHWEARLWFSEPLMKTANTVANRPVFNFSLIAQF